MAITTPGNRPGLCSSLAWKVPEEALMWKRRGVKLYFPGSGRKLMRDLKTLREKKEIKKEALCDDVSRTL